MATLAKQQILGTGTVLSYVAASGGGDSFPNSGNDILHVKNGDSGSHTVTINSIRPCDQGFDHDLVVVVAAGAEAEIGPFTVARFGRAVSVTYSAVTSVTVAIASL